ncbi:hypothetical protein D3C72_640120 [compost metagenome]
MPQVRGAVFQQFAGAGGLDLIAGLLHVAVGALQPPRQTHGLILKPDRFDGGGGLQIKDLKRRRLQGAGRCGGGGGGQTGQPGAAQKAATRNDAHRAASATERGPAASMTAWASAGQSRAGNRKLPSATLPISRSQRPPVRIELCQLPVAVLSVEIRR